MLIFLLACTPAAVPPDAPPAAEVPTPPVDAWSKVPAAEGALVSAAPMLEFKNAAGKVACPVMGMAMENPGDAVSFADHAGVRYYFCCDSCEKLFLEDPVVYANGAYLRDHNLDPSAPAACEEGKREG